MERTTVPEKIIYLRANFNDCKMQWNGTCTDGFYVDWKRGEGAAVVGRTIVVFTH